MKKQVSDAANEAKGNIDAATKDADVESAKNTGVEKINNINVPFLQQLSLIYRLQHP